MKMTLSELLMMKQIWTDPTQLYVVTVQKLHYMDFYSIGPLPAEISKAINSHYPTPHSFPKLNE